MNWYKAMLKISKLWIGIKQFQLSFLT